jgi:hypothetical protein
VAFTLTYVYLLLRRYRLASLEAERDELLLDVAMRELPRSASLTSGAPR